MTVPASRPRIATSNKEKGLERKLAAYAVASGAFLAAASAGQVQAGIYYSGPQDIQIDNGNPYTMNVTSGGPLVGDTTDFTFTNTLNYPPFSATLTVSSPVGTSQVVLDGSYAAALDAGTLISSSSTFGGGGTTTTMGTSSIKGKKDSGPWANASNLYLGLTFNDPGSTYYGWAELSFPDSTGITTLEGWAYQSDPGVGIVAGAVPEPSTLALSALALGSLGVSALLRRRKQVQGPAAS